MTSERLQTDQANTHTEPHMRRGMTMTRWTSSAAASTLSVTLLLGAFAAARGDDEKPKPADKPKSEMVKVPLDALEEVLKRHPNGSLMKVSEFRELLRKAGLTRLSDLD